MKRQRHIGVSYGRFSDPKQAEGDSEGRQERMYRAFCERHNLTPLTEVFLDKGRSGYRDEHRKKGRLGVLIRYAKDGRFEPGTVIVVEAWDRLGRLRPDRQTELVAELLRTGVRIGICRLDDIFSEDDFGTHKWTTLAVFIQLAYQESKQKAERVAESYVARQQAARDGKAMPPRKKDGRVSGLITDRLPFWLEVAGGACRPIPERAAAVQRIFALAGQGQGRARIVAALVREGVQPFGTGATWTRSYVNKILNDRRVLGEYAPRKTDGTPAGPALAGYYKRIITDEEWLLSRAGQELRRGKDRLGRALVRSERKHVNLFRSLLVSALDGEGFLLHQKVEGGKRRHVLASQAGQSGRAKNVSFPYLVFEEAVLQLLREVKPEDVLPACSPGDDRAAVLRARLANVRGDIQQIKEDLRTGYSKHLSDVLREREAEEERAAGELQDELAKSARPAEAAWRDLPGLAELVREKGDEARLALRPVLRRVVESGHVLIVRRGSYQLCGLQFFFAGGARRDYLIVNQAAAFNRAGGWWVRSLDAAVAPGDLDLRKRRDAKELAADLERLDLAELAARMEAAGGELV